VGLFGTDGVRGRANDDLTPELALAIASASSRVLVAHNADHRPVAVVGRDPRASGEMLEAAVVAGLTAAGSDVVLLGVLPTPAVAFLTAEYNADLGIVLSASHNPMPDNGIKLFARGGHKLPDEIEAEIEAEVQAGSDTRPIGAAVGRVRHAEDDAAQRYIAHVLAAANVDLTGLRLVVDCANGAASTVAPELYRRAGATVTAIHAEPDGLNINRDCGSTHLDDLVAAVIENGADLGIAHDGDADRCLAVAADGTLVDGDQILAMCAVALNAAGELARNTVVATVMSNLGFHHAMRGAGIDVITTAVGDRYVLEALRAEDLTLGGEQSGHVVFTSAATTGDGLLTALHVMGEMTRTGKPLAELATIVRRLPQTLINVEVHDRDVVSTTAVVEAVARAAAELGEGGRILLRPSGTEPLVRVMVEASSHEDADRIANSVADVVRSA
jgi:phosphoglucosamine mutase